MRHLLTARYAVCLFLHHPLYGARIIRGPFFLMETYAARRFAAVVTGYTLEAALSQAAFKTGREA